MRTKWAILAAVMIGLAFLAPGVSGAEASTKDKDRAEYLAMGDSVALGDGASDPSLGYVSLFHQFLESKAGLKKQLDLTNLAETGPCGLCGLPAAVDEIQARNHDKSKKNDVRAITMSWGAYDLFGAGIVCMNDGLTTECINAVHDILFFFSALFDYELGQLRSAAGPDTRIFVMTYYNPLANPGCEIHSLEPVWNMLLEGDAALGLDQGLNDLVRAAAASHGAEVVETFGLLDPSEVQPDCYNPNDAGHALIAEQFAKAWAN